MHQQELPTQNHNAKPLSSQAQNTTFKQLPKVVRVRPEDFQSLSFDEKSVILCQFCGGVQCDQENYLKNKMQPNAIQGLHSNWITDRILAMQRPTERIIRQFNLYTRFNEHHIRTVLNLQQPGEHAYCGDGIIPEGGFSYNPEGFYRHDIKVFNESWEDMSIPTFEQLMKIMNIFQLSLQREDKISVHCHAGRGRTLLVICAWLIYKHRMSAKVAIDLAIEKRQGVLSRATQRSFLFEFENYIRNRWKSYGIDNSETNTFTKFVDRQNATLLPSIKKQLYCRPYAHVKIIECLKKNVLIKENIVESIISLNELNWDEAKQAKLAQFKIMMNELEFKQVDKQTDARILTELLLDFYEQLPFTVVTSLSMEILEHFRSQPGSTCLKCLLEPKFIYNIGISSIAVIIDLAHFIKQLMSAVHIKEENGQSKTNGSLERLQDMASNQSIAVNGEHKTQQKTDNIKTTKQSMATTLYLRFSLVLLSKKVYFPRLFSKASRECKIVSSLPKIHRMVNSYVQLLGKFLQQLGQQLPEDQEELWKIVFLARKIDSNMYSLTKKASEMEEEFYDASQLQQICQIVKSPNSKPK